MIRSVFIVTGLLVAVGCERVPNLVNADELVAHPKRFAGRTFRVEGVWLTGFECSQLQEKNTALGGMIWVELDEGSVSTTSPQVWQDMSSKDTGGEPVGGWSKTEARFR